MFLSLLIYLLLLWRGGWFGRLECQVIKLEILSVCKSSEVLSKIIFGMNVTARNYLI